MTTKLNDLWLHVKDSYCEYLRTGVIHYRDEMLNSYREYHKRGGKRTDPRLDFYDNNYFTNKEAR